MIWLQIRKAILDKPIGRVPCCNFELRWKGNLEKTPTPPLYKILIKGTTNSNSSFTISYHPKTNGPVIGRTDQQKPITNQPPLSKYLVRKSNVIHVDDSLI